MKTGHFCVPPGEGGMVVKYFVPLALSRCRATHNTGLSQHDWAKPELESPFPPF